MRGRYVTLLRRAVRVRHGAVRVAESRAHKGAGVEFHVAVPSADIGAVYEAHRRHAESVTELTEQPWGERAFHAVLLGYRFLIAAGG